MSYNVSLPLGSWNPSSPAIKSTNRGLNPHTQGTAFQPPQDPAILCYWPQHLLQSPPSAEPLNIPSFQKVQLPTNRILNIWYLYMSATVWHIRIKHKFWNKQSLLMNSQLFPHFRSEKRGRKKIAIIWICREKFKSNAQDESSWKWRIIKQMRKLASNKWQIIVRLAANNPDLTTGGKTA